MTEVHTFIYYGAVLNKEDYENLTEKHGIMDLYGRVFQAGLSFRDVGEIGKSWTYVIGKEIHWEMESMFNMSYENGGFVIDSTKTSLKLEDESEVRAALLQIGITNPPKYRIFTCWGQMTGEE